MTVLNEPTLEINPRSKPAGIRRKKVQLKETLNFASRPVWASRFEEISGQALEKYLAGERKPGALLTSAQNAFLASLGTTAQELYDFIEDWCEYGEPTFETALRITEVRAEYFLREQQAQRSTRIVTPEDLPAKDAQLGGFVWLPRIIAKAQAKLRGEMSTDIMFGCGGDRRFLRKVGVDPVQFLRVVWNAGDDLEHIVEYVKISAQFHGDSLLNSKEQSEN